MTTRHRDNPGAVVATIGLVIALLLCAWQALTPKTPYRSPTYVEKQLDCGKDGRSTVYKGVAVCAHN